VIVIERLTKKYGAFEAVSALDLTVKPGEIYGFLGPNGAGKTTTMKVLSGLLRATAGKVSVCGHDVTADREAARRCMGYIPDEPHPYDRLTGREFLLTCAALYGVPGDRRADRVEHVLELFDLAPWGDELTESYSHGMRQKLMIASALIHEPKVVVADEPLVGLDPASARKLKEHFRTLADGGCAILMATHILEIAEKICDRVGIINAGRLLAEGTMSELRERANLPGQNLEEVFLALTMESSPVPKL
jgi:ABC-2 type transport system ATP-binding protein